MPRVPTAPGKVRSVLPVATSQMRSSPSLPAEMAWRSPGRKATARTSAWLNDISASGVTSVKGSERTPIAASSSSGVAGSPVRTRSLMSACCTNGTPICSPTRPSGSMIRSLMKVRKSPPVQRSMISASTQCAEVGWYS